MTRPHPANFASSDPGDRRQQILMACIRVVAERGFARTRMSDIAEEIGVTAPLLLHYFGSKNELVTQALLAAEKTYLVEFMGRFREGTSPAQLVVEYVEDSVWPGGDYSWWAEASALWINTWITALHDESIALLRVEEDRRWRAALTEVVSKGRQDRSFTGDAEPARFVGTLFALLDGFMVQLVLEDEEISRRFAHEESLRFVGRELGFDPYEFASRPSG